MRLKRFLAGAAVLALLAGVAAVTVRFEYAPVPARSSLANPEVYPIEAAYDVLGRSVSAEEAERLKGTEEGRRLLSPESGAVAVDAGLVEAGRRAFYAETYGNEVFLTEVVGMLDGGLSVWSVSRALAALAGRGTSDLKVRLARDVTIGTRTWKAGEEISTGLDVPRGGLFPLGVKTVYDRGRIRIGLTCAACHAAVEPRTGKVVEGAPNPDLNVGFLMALATNSTGYFMHLTVPSLDPYRNGRGGEVTDTRGGRQALPDPDLLEAEIDRQLASWPPGNFDSSADLVNNPTSTPSSFTRQAHPYGWSGHAGIGPFRGLSALNNNVHGLNSDATSSTLAAPTMFGMDPEVYLATVLRRSPRAAFRFEPGGSRRPSEVLAAADPTPQSPGLNTFAVLPSYPNANYVTSNSLVTARPGEPAGFSINAMSAYQNTLRPPQAPPAPASGSLERGRAVFERAGCGACHAGPAYTNNRIVPAPEVGTEPTRARAFARAEATVQPPAVFAPGTPTPAPPDAKLLPIPLDEDRKGQVALAWAHEGTPGGYKVPSLVGLAVTAPYLHDGGVSVGQNPEADLGVEATLFSGRPPSPANSLMALVDRRLRERVVAANRASERARLAHVTGEGHAYWADEPAGFSDEDQDDLIAYLLSLDRVAGVPSAPGPSR